MDSDKTFRQLNQILNLCKDGVSVWYICEILRCTEKELFEYCASNRLFNFVKSQWIVRSRSSSSSSAPRGGVGPNADTRIYHTWLLLKKLVQMLESNGNELLTFEEAAARANWAAPMFDILRHMSINYEVEMDSLSKFKTLVQCFCCFEASETSFRACKKCAEEIKAVAVIREFIKSHSTEYVTLQKMESELSWREKYESSLGDLYTYVRSRSFDVEWGVTRTTSQREQAKQDVKHRFLRSQKLLHKAHVLLTERGGETPIRNIVHALNWDRLGLGMLGSYINQYWGRWMRFNSGNVALVADAPPLPPLPHDLSDDDHEAALVHPVVRNEAENDEITTTPSPENGEGEAVASPPAEDTEVAPEGVTSLPAEGAATTHPEVWSLYQGDIYHVACLKIAIQTLADIPCNPQGMCQLSPLQGRSPSYNVELGRVVRATFHALRAQEADIEPRRQVHTEVLRLLKEGFPENPWIRLFVFGSSGCLLCTPTSDIDLCVLLDDAYNGHLSRQEVELKIAAIHQILKGGKMDVTAVYATVPIVKGKWNSVEFDISLSYCGVLNTTLLRKYMTDNVNVLPPLVMCVVAWSKYELINDSRNGFFSSYTLVLMTIYYLLRVGVVPLIPISAGMELPVVENPLRPLDASPAGAACVDDAKLGELFFGFFVFYGKLFDYAEEVVQIRSQYRMLKEFKSWTEFEFACEDPYETHLNTARHIRKIQFRVIQRKFQQTLRDYLLHPQAYLKKFSHVAKSQ